MEAIKRGIVAVNLTKEMALNRAQQKKTIHMLPTTKVTDRSCVVNVFKLEDGRKAKRLKL